MEYLVNIDLVNNVPVQFQVSPGEIVYCVSNPISAAMIKGIINQDDSELQGSVLGYDLSFKEKQELKNVRTEVGYVDESMYLSRDHTLSENLALYLAGFKNQAEIKSQFNKHLIRFGLDIESKVVTLTPQELFFSRLSLCLAKSPRLLVIPKSFTFASQSIFKQHMSYIYELIMEGGLTYIAAINNATITENFPGRIVTL